MTTSTLEESESGSSAHQDAPTPQQPLLSRRDLQEFPPIPALRQHPFQAAVWLLNASLGLVCLVAVLALTTSVPVLNVLALGYLMEAQGRVARTGKFRSAFFLVPAAQRLSGILLAVWLWLLPVQFLAHAARDSWLLVPGGSTAWLWTSLLAIASTLIAVHLLLSVARGGAWWRFVRPVSNARQLATHLRRGEYWHDAHHAVYEFAGALQLPQLVRLGLLAYAAAYIWLTVPTLLFTSLDDVTSTWQLLAFLAGGVALTATLLWLPLLLTHVAAEGRWGAIFEFTTTRTLAGRTPFRWALATAILLACSAVPLLYAALFKIRIPPHDAKWDLMLVFLVTVVPARLLVAWVYHGAMQRLDSRSTWLRHIWQWGNGMVLFAGVGFYVYFLDLASTGGELGELSIWQFHALLLPLPF